MRTKTILIALLIMAALSFGQTALSTTTLGAAVTTSNCARQTVTLGSTSTMLGLGTQNQYQTVFYTDRELFGVVSVTDSTHVVADRCKGIGASGRPVTHANTSKVYFANTSSSNPNQSAMSAFKNDQPDAEQTGSCTSTSEMWLPRIYLRTGDIMDCRSSGQWILISNGTAGQVGSEIRGWCTGTAGSGETEFLNGAACSGATTSTSRYMVSAPGTLAGLFVFSSAAVTGGASKDVVTVFKNGSSTALTCTMAASATSCSDAADSVVVAAGDVVTFQFVSASGDTAANIAAAVSIF